MDVSDQIEPKAGPDDDLHDGLKARLTRPRTMVTMIIVGVVIVILLLVLSSFEDARYTVQIERTFTTEQERRAIEIAESLDTTDLLDSPRYDRWGNDPTNTPPDDLNIYVYPNVIDEEAIDYFKWRVDAQRNLVSDDRAEMEYTARAISFTNLSMFIIVDEESGWYQLGTWDRTIGYHGDDLYVTPSVKIDRDGNMKNIESGYLVFQRLDYSESYGPLAAYHGIVKQFTILDDDYSVLLICTETEMGIS
jgi:hypothetical protein